MARSATSRTPWAPHVISEVLTRPIGSLWYDVARWLAALCPGNRVGQSWSRAAPSQHGSSDSPGAVSSFLPTGAVGVSLAHQQAPGGSHSSLGRQGTQENVAPPQAFMRTQPQAERNSDLFQSEEFLIEGAAKLSEGPPWAQTHRPSLKPRARSPSFPASGYSRLYPH